MRAELSGLSDDFLICRDRHHVWDDYDVKEHTRDKVLHIIQKCSVCAAERTQILSRRKDTNGFIIKSWMSHYPEGYLLPKGSGRMDQRDRGDIRMARRGYF